MKAFILALLPGLEEETGEFFDQVRHDFPNPPVFRVRSSDKS
jgi:NTP pyrophosphatase (non-canonical NTP hydrolase)